MQVVLIRLFGPITRQAKGNIVGIAFQTVFVRTKGKILATLYHAVHCSPAITQPSALLSVIAQKGLMLLELTAAQ